MKNNIKSDNSGKKILLIGANGFLGTNILNLINEKETIDQNLFFYGADLINTNISQDIPFFSLDITNLVNVSKTINNIIPDVIILTAAMTNVDQCEKDKNIATRVNVEGPKNIIKACKKLNSKLIFISTDFVFDGTKEEGEYYSELDPPLPLNHYAKTKYEAEQSIINSGIEYLICRTAVLYGWNKNKLNFVTWMLKNFGQNSKISLINNQINSPTYVRNLSEIILKLIEKDAHGIYHTAGNNALSRYNMGLNCAEIFDFSQKLIIGIDNLEQQAIRPKNVGLDISKLNKLIGHELKILNFEEGLRNMKKLAPT